MTMRPPALRHAVAPAVALCLVATAFIATPNARVAAATSATNYRPNHLVHLDAGTYFGYKFSPTGGIVASKKGTLTQARNNVETRLRTTISNRTGYWILIVNGWWAGYYLQESNRIYLPFTRLRTVNFSGGTHTGYRFNAAGAIVGKKTITLPPSSSSAITQARIGASVTYLRMVNGPWVGYWVPITTGIGLRYPVLGTNRLSITPAIHTTFNQPIFVTNAHDGTARFFIVERPGLVRVFRAGSVLPTAFLDLTTKVRCCDGERGLLGLAFHPAFASNHRLFAYYTDAIGDIIVAEYTANAGNTVASASTERVLLHISHSTYNNHDGGWIAFGPDSYLYIDTGDGGGGGDPLGSGQNKNTLLGKILRIDVNGALPYAIPPTNPFAVSGGAKEIWAYGLRNPWRSSFDRERGDLYIGDVGQNNFEEIDRARPGAGGQNYGWNVMEGFSCYGASTCATAGKTLPIAAYAHGTSDSIGCAVTGGYMYRGSLQPALQGHYIFGDYCTGRIWTLYQDENVADMVAQGQFAVNISSFGESESGDVYLVGLSNGIIYRVVVKP